MSGGVSGDHAHVRDRETFASFKERMAGLSQELIEMIESKYFPDWALEEISARLKNDTLTLRDLIAIIGEAREDMDDLVALSKEPVDQESYTLNYIKQEFGNL